MARQGRLDLLGDRVAKALPGSADPAGLACAWVDGSPGVVPVWFDRAGDQLVPWLAL